MKLLNVNKRVVNQPKSNISELLKTLSTENDRVWPTENWTRMRFENGIQIGAKGGQLRKKENDQRSIKEDFWFNLALYYINNTHYLHII